MMRWKMRPRPRRSDIVLKSGFAWQSRSFFISFQYDRSERAMIALAVICTLIVGVIGAYLEPVSFAVSLPIAVMGGFILKALSDRASAEK